MFLIGFQVPNDIIWFFDQHSKLSSLKDLDINKTKFVELEQCYLYIQASPSKGPAVLSF